MQAGSCAPSPCSLRSGDSTTVTFDPAAGVVETRSGDGFHRWSVPTDPAWAWLTSGCGEDRVGAHITTPVAVLVAARASKHHDVLRLIATHKFSGHTITVDQVVVPEDTQTWSSSATTRCS